MAIKTIIEESRQATHLFGSTPEFTRIIRVELTDPVSVSLIVQACGVQHGAPHPEVFAAKCYSVETEEGLIEAADIQFSDGEPATIFTRVTALYRIQDEMDVLPWQRTDTWRFQTQGVAVPALFYYDGVTQKPLTNSAGDYFEGLTVDEAQQKITITANRQAFPSALAAAVTNCVNGNTYLGFAPNCVKVQGISGEKAVEEVNGQKVEFWKITSELLCRQTSWNLLLPDVGFNYIADGIKKRAFVEGPDGEMIASANPVALDGSGGLRSAGLLPAILTRRIYPEILMSSYFGTPPS